jgi:hypothetical protein
MSVKEIEQAIAKLPAEELTELAAWFSDYLADIWDKQIERDLKTGRLDALIKEVEAEYDAGLSQPLCNTGPCLASGSTTTNCLKKYRISQTRASKSSSRIHTTPPCTSNASAAQNTCGQYAWAHAIERWAWTNQTESFGSGLGLTPSMTDS